MDLIDVKSADQTVSSLLADTVHRDVLGMEINFLEGEMPDDNHNSNCLPGVCSCNEHFSKVCALVRALQSSLQEKQIKTGSLLLLTCRDSPFTRTFFTGVVLKRPLLQTAVLVSIGDDRVSFKGKHQPKLHKHQLCGIPEVTTTHHIFLEIVESVGNATIEVEHWSYTPFVNDVGALHVNPDAVLETFEICLSNKPEVAKKNPVNLPFGLKPDRVKRKQNSNRNEGAAGGAPRKIQKQNVSVSVQNDNGSNNNDADTDSDLANDSAHEGNFSMDGEGDEDEIEPTIRSGSTYLRSVSYKLVARNLSYLLLCNL